MKRFTLGLLALLFSFSVQAAPTVNIIPNQFGYQVGDTVLLSVFLSDSPPIHGGGLNIRFNPNVLQAQSVVVDKVWSFANRPGVINNAVGSIGEIVFSSFNPVYGDLGVAIIQLAVVGNGNSGFFVTESSKNPFSDANGQVVSFNINNLFGFNTTVAEQTAEETTDQTTTQTMEETSEQTTTQNTSTDGTTTTTSSNNGDTGFSNKIGFVRLANTTANKKQVADNSQNDRQFFLPSGPGAIPINVTDDNEVEEQANTAMNSDTAASPKKTVDQHAQETIAAENVGESLSASETATSDGQNAQAVSEIQQFVDAGNIESDDSIDYLTFVLIFAAVFVLFIAYQVFYKK